jgi:hypothetical protein
MTLYYIRKYADGWAIHNDENGKSRLLNEQEIEALKKEFPILRESKVRTLFIERINSIKEKP